MANKDMEFFRKMKRIMENRAVIVTVVTVLVATGVIIAATVAANRAKQPTVKDPVGSVTTAPSTNHIPSGKDEATLPTYNEGETKPVGADPDEPEAMLALPVEGKLYKDHDATIQVYSNTMGDYRVHLGLDIATAPEAPVLAAADGKVERVWEDAMMGTCVAVAHTDDAVTFYKNLAKDLAEGITVGATVQKGQTLGYVGDTAVVEMADEPHLHFEMTVKGLSVDPMDYFSRESAETLSKDTAFESNADTDAGTSAATRPSGK